MPKGTKPWHSGEYHYVFTCPCMEGVVKTFSSNNHRRMYIRLHDKKCNIPAIVEHASGYVYQKHLIENQKHLLKK